MTHDFIPVNLLFCLLTPTNLFWAPPFNCIFKYFVSYFPASCRELQLAYCILHISAVNLFIACPCSRELLWIGFCRGALLYLVFIHSLRHLLWGVVRHFNHFMAYIPQLRAKFMVHIGQGSVEQKWESNLCQTYGDFELNVALWQSQIEIYGRLS